MGPGDGPNVDMNMFGFLHEMANLNALHPRMFHDLFCRPPRLGIGF